ncbi:MAG: group I truncated hemoglobin [Burkholderiales bacterium]
MMFKTIHVAAVAVMVIQVACVSKADFKDRSLYQRLGGRGAIVAMTDDFAAIVATDPRIGQHFASADMNRMKKMLASQVCALSGGPCVYTGKDMKTAHAGRDIGEDGFNAFMENLAKTLEKFKIPGKEKNELLALLAAMKKDIVTK